MQSYKMDCADAAHFEPDARRWSDRKIYEKTHPAVLHHFHGIDRLHTKTSTCDSKHIAYC